MKALIKQAETALSDVFKGLPQFPDNSKEALAKFWPWLALIGGLVQVVVAVGLWHLANYADRINGVLSVYYTSDVGPSSFEKLVIYLGIATLLVQAVLLLMAYPKLKNRERAGWDLLFLSAMVNVVYGVLQIFTFQRGVASFIGSLVACAIWFYLLFQVREKFNKGSGTSPRQPK